MSFPHAWARLPGPADLLAAIVGDLSDRNSVFVGLPEDASGALFAVEVADLVKRDRCVRPMGVGPIGGGAHSRSV